MHFRLLKAGNAAEEVFNAGREHGHAVGLELGDVDDNVRLKNGLDDIEGTVPKPLGAEHLLPADVLIQLSVFRKAFQSADRINRVERGRRIRSARAVRNDDVADAHGPQLFDDGREQLGTRSDGGLRSAAADEIGLNQNAHAGLDEFFGMNARKMPFDRGVKQVGSVFRNLTDRDDSHSVSSFQENLY